MYGYFKFRGSKISKTLELSVKKMLALLSTITLNADFTKLAEQKNVLLYYSSIFPINFLLFSK